MRTYLECIPCFVRQTLEALRFVTEDEGVQEKALREVIRQVSEMDLGKSPPVMGQRIHRVIREVSGDEDPYRVVKVHFNLSALRLYPELKELVEGSGDALEAGVRLAIAGNVIDFGIQGSVEEADVREAIEEALEAPLERGPLEYFGEAMERAEKMLYLGDNAGEIVFDRLLIEQMPREKVTYVVRGGPVINDATMEDARETGLMEIVEVIDNGSDAPGTILETCSDGFRKRFDEADLIVAKGQGNYETVSEAPKEIFFALKAKCPVIARDLGCEVGEMIFRRKNPPGRV